MNLVSEVKKVDELMEKLWDSGENWNFYQMGLMQDIDGILEELLKEHTLDEHEEV